MPSATSFRLLLILIFLSASGPVAAESVARAIDRCINTIAGSQKTRNEKKKIELDFYCADLPRRINQLPLSRNLSYKFDSTSSIEELRDLRHFLGESTRTKNRNFRFNYSSVKKIVDEVMPAAPEAEPSLWSRFWHWVGQFLPSLDDKESGEVDKFLKSFKLSKQAGEIIFYVSSAIIFIIAVWIVVREWLYFRRKGVPGKTNRASRIIFDDPAIPRVTTLGELSKLPERFRAPALLHWSIDYCIDKGELPQDQSLTSREMVQILTGRGSAYTKFFRALVKEAEKVVYGNSAPDNAVLEQLLMSAENLGSTPRT